MKRMRIGTWVRLKQPVSTGPQKAQIEDLCSSLAPGAVRLTLPLDGMRYWNKEDLVVTSAPKTLKR